MNAIILSSGQNIPWDLMGVVLFFVIVVFAAILVILLKRLRAKVKPPQTTQPLQQERGTVRSITEVPAKDMEDQCFLIQVDNGRELIPFRWSFPRGQPKPNGFPVVGNHVMIVYEFAFHETRECWIPKGFNYIGEGEQEHAGE